MFLSHFPSFSAPPSVGKGLEDPQLYTWQSPTGGEEEIPSV